MNFGGRIQWDGAFAITNVPPGRYMLRARGDDSRDAAVRDAADHASTAATSTDVTVVLSAGRDDQRHGVVPARRDASAPDVTQVRITAPSTDQSDVRPAAERARGQGRPFHARRRRRPARI